MTLGQGTFIPQDIDLSSEVDNSTIEYSGGQLQIKDNGVTNTKLGSGTLSAETGTYTGDGSTSQQINLTNTDLNPVFIIISQDDTPDAPIYVNFWSETMGSNKNVQLIAGVVSMYDDNIIAEAQGSFTVDDRGADDHPNKNGVTYHYLVIGELA